MLTFIACLIALVWFLESWALHMERCGRAPWLDY